MIMIITPHSKPDQNGLVAKPSPFNCLVTSPRRKRSHNRRFILLIDIILSSQLSTLDSLDCWEKATAVMIAGVPAHEYDVSLIESHICICICIMYRMIHAWTELVRRADNVLGECETEGVLCMCLANSSSMWWPSYRMYRVVVVCMIV